MGETTGIAWTDSTFNGWIGCQRVSPGCQQCYAEALDKRTGGGVDPSDGVKKLRWGPSAPRVRTSVANWKKPIQWNAKAAKLKTRHRVFCSSLADVFEDREELVAMRYDLFSIISATPWLDWQLLTKRPENIERLWPGLYHRDNCGIFVDCPPPGSAWPNVWLGCTVEDQQRADERLPCLLDVPAAVHFASCEPLLEHVDISRWMRPWNPGSPALLSWLIVGGESGHGARPFSLDWARSLRDQTVGTGTAYFMKQLGDNSDHPGAGRHGANPDRWPKDIQLQSFPTTSEPSKA